MTKTFSFKQAVAASVFITFALSFAFTVLVEPIVSRAVEDQFTIKQTITAEIAFTTAANDVVMNGSIAGLTGGISYGTTTSVVTTNNTTGFTMTIKASSSPAMQGESNGSSIPNYTPATAGVPDFAFSVPSGAEFGFSASASTTADIAKKFQDNGSTCDVSSGTDTGSGSCWMELPTTATSTMVTSTATGTSGATSSYYFIVRVNNGTNQAAGIYNATATLTAVIN